jgi:hypothetical protein
MTQQTTYRIATLKGLGRVLVPEEMSDEAVEKEIKTANEEGSTGRKSKKKPRIRR